MADACKGHGSQAARTTAAAFPAEYGLANQIQHPRNIYVREDAILPRLDAWLGGLFDPDNLDATVAALAAADDDTTRAQIERAERTLPTASNGLPGRSKRARQAHAPPPSRDELESLIRGAGELVPILA